jgi:hypothetical protein
MQISKGAKILIAMLALMGILGYLFVLEFGLSAGRVHSGVRVGKVDLSGLTLSGAAALLDEVGGDLQNEPIVFITEGLTECLIPKEIGWTPQALVTAQRAMDVGRQGGIAVLGDRLDAWISGVHVEWEGKPHRRKLRKLLDAWEAEVEALGFELRRWRLRQRIKRAIVTYPREAFDIPVRPKTSVTTPQLDVAELEAGGKCDNLPN